MKKAFVILLSLFSLFSSAQKINEYQFVMVPTKFAFQDSENEYRLSTLLKYRLEQYGFNAIYTSDQLNMRYSDRCQYLNADVIKESNIFLTKMYVVFKDCKDVVVFKSELGTSKIKMRKDGYREALEKALESVKALNYKFIGKNINQKVVVSDEETYVAIEKTDISNDNMLSARPIENGFQIVDTTQNVILEIYKTSQADYFSAKGSGKNGVVFKKDGEWFFEYYINDKLISEKLNIKF